MTRPKLISFNLCPFVQRAAVLLQEQERAYDLEYIDLRNKPDWFLKLSPFGKVPLLQVGDTVLFESNVILGYLDDTAPAKSLLPEDPLERATHRMWIELVSAVMSKGWTLQAAKDEPAAREALGEVRSLLKRLSDAHPGDGPLWGGETLTLVDVSIAPILQRFTWAEKLEPSLRIFEDLPRIAAWRDALLARPSLTSSIVPGLEEINAKTLHGIGSWIARDAS